MHCLLLGNGLNRLSMSLSWHELLERLAADLGLAGLVRIYDQKPLSLHFEELCVRLTDYGKVRDAENAVKKQIAELVDIFPIHPLHVALASQFQVILTTNYDFTIEESLGGGIRTRNTVLPESRYSLFRRMEVGTRTIWHIHGEASRPQSILLGYDHYAGYLQKMRNYLTNGVPSEGVTGQLRSPLRAGLHDFEKYDVHSWVDYFLRDHLHVVGFGFDFTEIDLWWLVVYKRRRYTRTGKTYFYIVNIDGTVADHENAKLSLFDSIGVEAVVVQASSYEDGYVKIVDAVSSNIARHKDWLPHSLSKKPSIDGDDLDRFLIRRRAGDAQLNLPLRRLRKRRPQ
ncbi:SIR2-like domain-containing protein [Dyella sp. OK004]|uniref:SIR2 family protein n=1 Tax=Dyella sp. OK004 TaxID=1855292 RepID=UPI0008E9D1AB|nr:SIR2 family protein [Dyella sp. OK004]SFS11780.1 SIR2-like domain-containing protein [Dyella sp. OK004]